MKTFYWLVKREFWENRGSFLWAPVITGIIVLVLDIMGLITAEVFRSRANVVINGIDFNAFAQHLDAEHLHTLSKMLDAGMMLPSMLIGLVLFVVVFFYCIHALWDDRNDRSILFWKSLPVSDLSTVLSKVFCATLLAPAISIIVSVAVGWSILLLMAITGAFHGINLFHLLWSLPHPFHFIAVMVGMLPIYALWALPCVGWLLLCSASARGKPMRWAIGLPVGVGVLASWLHILDMFEGGFGWYWKNIAGRALLSVLPGSWVAADNSLSFHNGSGEVVGKHLANTLFNLRYNYEHLFSAPF
ncbi:MAG: hypothetical protein L0H70_00805, partial [Xanthomonadales bacterium]|nr:hypothetical protein [Xanthomonadales bacterium]